MTMTTGTHDITFLLAQNQVAGREYGFDRIVEVLTADLQAHNERVADELTWLAEPVTVGIGRNGSSVQGTMEEVDDHARGTTSREQPGSNVGFPLRKYRFALGWTRDFEDQATPADYATGVVGAQRADIRRLSYLLKLAVYTPTNSTFYDRYVLPGQIQLNLPVRALYNADSEPIPDSPWGEVFNAATHTHYDANATLTTTALDASITNLTEHGYSNDVKIIINKNDRAGFEALTGFVRAVPANIIPGNQADVAVQRMDSQRTDNRMIGVYDEYEVWVKPWAIQNYAIITDVGSMEKPFAYRQHALSNRMGLFIEADDDNFPYRSQYMTHYMGFGAYNRGNMVVLKFDNASYSAPTITE